MIQEPFRVALAAAVEAWATLPDYPLVSAVLFGSVARGTARPDSDVDLLLVAHGLPRSFRDRRRPFLDAWRELLAAMKTRMQTLGSRRVHLADGSWYWDLKPDFRFGEIVEI